VAYDPKNAPHLPNCNQRNLFVIARNIYDFMMDFLRDLKSVSVSNGSSKQSEKESLRPTKNIKIKSWIIFYTLQSLPDRFTISVIFWF
jgi:hypothetical protein